MKKFNIKRFVKGYFSKLYACYFVRWQISTLVMSPFMYLFENLGLSAVPNLIITQIIGSLIFFNLDKIIFRLFDTKGKTNDNSSNDQKEQNVF